MAESTKIKSKAKVFVCQNKEQTAECIKKIGDKKREIVRLETEINDITAQAIDERKDRLAELEKNIISLSEGVQVWCEANREILCTKGKTANLITGEVSWRISPPKVNLRKIEDVIKELKDADLRKFIRIKEEVNKEAILADPLLASNIKGISINSGIEEFAIKPFEVEVTN